MLNNEETIKKQEDTSVETKIQVKSVTSEREKLEEQLLYLCSCKCPFCESFDIAKFNEERSLKR